MYEVSIRQHFDAAHYLRGYKGKCERVHGHRFQVVVAVRAKELDGIGLAYDFMDLKQHLKGVLERLDHALLNDLPPFDSLNPSSENLAAVIYREMLPKLGGRASLSRVEVGESPEASVTYIPGG